MSLLPVQDALAAILARVPAVTDEDVPLAEANGRVLAAPIVARHNQPPFNASAMDGYAVRAGDVTPGKPLRLIGTSQAGAGFTGSVGADEAVRIFTGAPVPSGADAVIMQEKAESDGITVRFSAETRAGSSVRPIGNDFAEGQVLLEPGRRLGPMQLAMAAAANAASLTVARRPRIALLATGDELVEPGTTLGPDQIVSSNSYGLMPLLQPYAQHVGDFGIVGDDPTALTDRLNAIFDDSPDILITTGGASVGDHDIVREILVSAGVSLDFWRINMRPGKPLMFGRLDRLLFLGLPGNPVSAIVCAHLFLRPLIRKLLGDPRAGMESAETARLGRDLPENDERQDYLRATLAFDGGALVATPFARQDSGMVATLAHADALVVRAPHAPPARAGDACQIIRL